MTLNADRAVEDVATGRDEARNLSSDEVMFPSHAGSCYEDEDDEDDEDNIFFDCRGHESDFDNPPAGNGILAKNGQTNDESNFEDSDKENRRPDGEESDTDTDNDYNEYPSDGENMILPGHRLFVNHSLSDEEEVIDGDHRDFEIRRTTRSPLSTLEWWFPTNTDTVDEAVASEGINYASTAGYDTDSDTSTLVKSSSDTDYGDEADMEEGTAFDGSSDDEDPCRDVVPQNAAADDNNAVRFTGWVLDDIFRNSGAIALPGKRGRDSDEEDDGVFFETYDEWRARKRVRGQY